MSLVDGGRHEFLLAFGVLLVVRTFFGVIEWAGGILIWRLHGRRAMTDRLLAILRAGSFPRRKYQHDKIANYLCRITDDLSLSPALREAAKQFDFMLSNIREWSGMMAE